ncbi:MAG: CoA transferase [Betaproteobacteria bacterium]|nr:MAG: CoA transferase [Betaproteobacteria bacterium]
MSEALAGTLVVEIGQAVAAPFCGTRLAEAGARVIKVERPEGDFARAYDSHWKGDSLFFAYLNRGKESITLDLKNPADAALLHKIIDQADVFIQNLIPGAAERAGFGSDALRARNPRLITCDISGYGLDGPYRDMKAYDLLIQAESGLAAVSGTPEAPGRCGVSVCDMVCATNAYAGILQAIVARQRTGVGAGLSISLFDGLADWMSVFLSVYELTGKAPPRTGFSHSLIAPYGAFRIGDGTKLVIAVQNQREWQRFCEIVLQRPELANQAEYADNPARNINRDSLNAAIEEIFSHLDRATVVTRLRRAAIGYGAINEVADLAKHPALRRAIMETGKGPLQIVAPPLRIDGEAGSIGRVPALGEHTEKIRAEFPA